VDNDGTASPPVLLLSGTIAMPYRAVNYNIPIDVYLSPSYPARAPVVFVRPVSSMEVKERHRHVAQADGKVYMPYLHNWQPHSHNLIELVVTMSSLFSNDPPVYSKPAQQPPPPPYSVIQQSQVHQQAAAEEQIRLAQEMSRAEEGVRRMREKHEEGLQREKMQQYEVQLDHEKRMQLKSNIKTALFHLQSEAKIEIENCCFDIVRMEKSVKILSEDEKESQFKILRERKQTLENYQEQVTTSTEQLEKFVISVEEEKKSSSDELDPDAVDKIVLPDNLHSKQMLELSSENASISDLMYFMDRALVKETLPLDVHLKEIRKLAKKQFLTRALLLKIGQTVTKERAERDLFK